MRLAFVLASSGAPSLNFTADPAGAVLWFVLGLLASSVLWFPPVLFGMLPARSTRGGRLAVSALAIPAIAFAAWAVLGMLSDLSQTQIGHPVVGGNDVLLVAIASLNGAAGLFGVLRTWLRTTSTG